MDFKSIDYDPIEVNKTISRRGRRKKDGPTKIFADQLKDKNVKRIIKDLLTIWYNINNSILNI